MIIHHARISECFSECSVCNTVCQGEHRATDVSLPISRPVSLSPTLPPPAYSHGATRANVLLGRGLVSAYSVSSSFGESRHCISLRLVGREQAGHARGWSSADTSTVHASARGPMSHRRDLPIEGRK